MITISKSEKEIIEKLFPNTHIVRTMAGDSKRHHYYCTEDKDVMRFLMRFRFANTVEEKGDAYDRREKKRW